MNIKAFAVGVSLGAIAQLLTFVQLQGQIKWEWFKQHPYIVAFIAGFPISLLFMTSVKYLIEAFQGQLWPSRLIGFSVGAVVFAIMSWLMFKEPFTMKTIVSLILAACILTIQIAWK
jgi:multidrug transporter EmrE-like cation transporter